MILLVIKYDTEVFQYYDKNLWAFSDFTPASKVVSLFISLNFSSLDKNHKKAHITEDHNPLGCDNIQFGRMVPTPLGKLLLLSSR